METIVNQHTSSEVAGNPSFRSIQWEHGTRRILLFGIPPCHPWNEIEPNSFVHIGLVFACVEVEANYTEGNFGFEKQLCPFHLTYLSTNHYMSGHSYKKICLDDTGPIMKGGFHGWMVSQLDSMAFQTWSSLSSNNKWEEGEPGSHNKTAHCFTIFLCYLCYLRLP